MHSSCTKELVNSASRYRYNDLVRPENQLLLNGTKMDWKSLVISDFVIPDLQNGQKWPKCPQNGFMIFAPWKFAQDKLLSCSVHNMSKKLLLTYKESSDHADSPRNQKNYFRTKKAKLCQKKPKSPFRPKQLEAQSSPEKFRFQNVLWTKPVLPILEKLVDLKK